MSIDFVSRIVGMLVFALVGARVGIDVSQEMGIPQEATSFIFALVGILFGLILTPWLTVRPIRFISRMITEQPVENLFAALAGLMFGLFIALLAAYPLSLLGRPFGDLIPAILTVVGAYFGMTIFRIRARELWSLLNDRVGTTRKKPLFSMTSDRPLLLDTSVLIDGRIVDIAKTGFIGGSMIVPRFVLSELHQVADSSDTLRRNRGRRGLAKLNELQRESDLPFKIIEDDIEELNKVDDKLVALAVQMNAPILTNDFNLNRVAEAQGVTVLNINLLANAVRAIYIPGETFPIHIIQEGRESDQGVGYLEDGTMVVVEEGKSFMDRTINVTVTKLINKEAGRMIFAQPAVVKR
ncbi:MAG: PIN domain nuclease [Burkholderiales bacterium]|nr:PIN domain nuclease [Anaerolineae bacterium]